MAAIKIEGAELVVQMEGFAEKMMALRSEIRVPLSHVKGARAKPAELLDDTFILRVFGASLTDTHLGYFWKKGEGLVFLDIHHLREGNIVAIDLEHERMKHLYVEGEHGESAEAIAARIIAAIPAPAA